MNWIRTLIIPLVFNCLNLNLYAQHNYIVYTTKDGLPHNTVTCTYKDKEGYLWIGTFGGLSRFDGTHFHNLPIGDIKSENLAADIILDIEESKDKIWVAHSLGLSVVDKKSLHCKNYTLPDINRFYLLKNAIHDIYIDDSNKIWLGSSQGLFYFNEINQKIESVLKKSSTNTKIKFAAYNIIPQKENKFLLFSGKGYYYYDKIKNDFDSTIIKEIPTEYLKGQNIRLHRLWNSYEPDYFVHIDNKKLSIKFSKQDKPNAIPKVFNIYVNSSGDIFVNTINKTGVVYNSNYWKNSPQLPNNAIHFNDVNGSILFGTYSGLWITDNNNSTQYKINIKELLENNGIKFSGIRNCKPYYKTKLLLSCNPGLHFLDYKSNKIISSRFWKDSIVIMSHAAAPDKVYVTTNDRVYVYNPLKEEVKKICDINSYIVAIEPWKNKLIFATRSNGLFFIDVNSDKKEKFNYTGNQQQFDTVFNRITELIPYLSKDEFVVTHNDSTLYSIINLPEKRVTNYPIHHSNFQRNENFPIQTTCIIDSSIWFGCYLGGILYKDKYKNKWHNITTSHGLYHNAINQIKFDGKKYLWVLTRGGINLIDVKTYKVKKYSNQLLTIKRPSLFIDSTNHLFICDHVSLGIININDFTLTQNDNSLLISKIFQDATNLKQDKKIIVLPYSKNYLTFEFSVFKFNNNILYNYYYRLNSNEQWKSIGNQTQLYLNNLIPGEYNFQIKATDQYEESSLISENTKIIIVPPFWQTIWFKLMLFFSFILLTYVFIRHYIKNKLEKERLILETQMASQKERERLLADLHDDVGASLSSIHINSELAERIQESKPAVTKKLLINISRESKEISSKLSDFIWSIKQETNGVVNFKQRILDYQQQIFEDKEIKFYSDIHDADISNDVNFVKNILLIVKEAFNNITKYSEATEVHLTIISKNNHLELSILDNGKGFDITKTLSGNGLGNMRKRCEINGGHFEIKSEIGLGTEIICRWKL